MSAESKAKKIWTSTLGDFDSSISLATSLRSSTVICLVLNSRNLLSVSFAPLLGLVPADRNPAS